MSRPFSRELYSQVGKAISDYSMLKDGDHVVLGVSGGKDSLVMSRILAELKKRAPVAFTLSAVTVDPGEPGGYREKDILALESFFKSIDVSYFAIKTRISRILEIYPGRHSACSLCAHLRRGVLYKTARDTGAGKVALGHHLDDAIETFFLNMFYQGNLKCFQPKTFMSRSGTESIRPLVYVTESEIERCAQHLNLPVVSPKCRTAGGTRRQSMKELVSNLAESIPDFRGQMRGALKRLWLPQKKV